MTDDLPPPPSSGTIPSPPPEDPDAITVIAAGDAQRAFGQALDNLVSALLEVEKIGMAICRQLDESCKG
jgi:hypothetical protein